MLNVQLLYRMQTIILTYESSPLRAYSGAHDESDLWETSEHDSRHVTGDDRIMVFGMANRASLLALQTVAPPHSLHSPPPPRVNAGERCCILTDEDGTLVSKVFNQFGGERTSIRSQVQFFECAVLRSSAPLRRGIGQSCGTNTLTSVVARLYATLRNNHTARGTHSLKWNRIAVDTIFFDAV